MSKNLASLNTIKLTNNLMLKKTSYSIKLKKLCEVLLGRALASRYIKNASMILMIRYEKLSIKNLDLI